MKHIPLDYGTPILTGPKQIKVSVGNEYTTRKLNPSIRTELDFGGTIEIPEHRSLGDRAEASVVSSPRIIESSNFVDVDCSLVSVLIVRRDINENSFANQTPIEFDMDAIIELQIVSIKGEHL